MDQIQEIRYLKERKDRSLRSIAEETGHAFETVKKYVERQDFNIECRPKQERCGKLAPYRHHIDEWLEADRRARPKQRHSAQRVYDRLKEIYGDDFTVSDRSVRKYVAKKKVRLYQENSGYLPLEHPGGEAQADFGAAQFIENGILYDGHYLNLSFPYSNAGYLQLFKGENQECLLEGLRDIFEHTGRVPNTIWFDNASTIVKKIRAHGERDITQGFKRFALHYGFESNFCNPECGHEKGSVENKVGYHRRNFLVPVPEFNDLQDYNKGLLIRCDADADRAHYKKGRSISQLHQEEKEHMGKAAPTGFDIYRLVRVKADNYGKVKLETNTYSTSPEYAKQAVWVQVGAHEVRILNDDYRMVQTHARLYGSKKESMKWVPYLQLMSKRPTALRYSGFFNELPQGLQEYFTCCSYHEKKAALSLLARMVEETDIKTAQVAFELAIERRLRDTDSIWATYYTLTRDESFVGDIVSAPSLAAYSVDVAAYDVLFKGGDR